MLSESQPPGIRLFSPTFCCIFHCLGGKVTCLDTPRLAAWPCRSTGGAPQMGAPRIGPRSLNHLFLKRQTVQSDGSSCIRMAFPARIPRRSTEANGYVAAFVLRMGQEEHREGVSHAASPKNHFCQADRDREWKCENGSGASSDAKTDTKTSGRGGFWWSSWKVVARSELPRVRYAWAWILRESHGW